MLLNLRGFSVMQDGAPRPLADSDSRRAAIANALTVHGLPPVWVLVDMGKKLR
jgi:hypothetical protein